MDKRAEPRFQVQSAVRLASLDQPESVSEALLLEVSGAGMRIIADRAWPLDAPLVVELENHVVLAHVRNCAPRGTKFTIGAQKVHSLLKLMLPAGAPRSEWHKILRAETEAPAKAANPTDAIPAEAECLQQPSHVHADQEPVACENHASGANGLPEDDSSADVDALARQLSAAFAEAQAKSNQSAAVREVQQLGEAAAIESGEPPLARAFPTNPPAAVPSKPAGVSLAAAPNFESSCGLAPSADALTPISTLPEIALPESQPRWILSAAVAAGLLCLAALGFYFGPFRPRAVSAPNSARNPPPVAPLTIPSVIETSDATPSTPAAVTPATGAAGTPTNSALSASGSAPSGISPATPARALVPIPAATATIAPHFGSRRATLTASGMNWVSACADGRPSFAKLMSAGEIRAIDFERTAVFRIGNSGAADIAVDGKPVGPPGSAATPKILEISAAGVRELPKNVAPGAECQAAGVPSAATPSPKP